VRQPGATPSHELRSQLVRERYPRSSEHASRHLLRRGYPLILAEVDRTRRGLVFVALARTFTTQFEFMTRAWTPNPNPDFRFARPGTDALRALEAIQ